MPTAVFTIHVGVALTPAWAEWFDGMTIVPGPDGTTKLTGSVRDQAALFGLLIRVRDLGLPLLGVYPGPEAGAGTDHASFVPGPAPGEPTPPEEENTR
jgi:hypothetical protein